VNEHGKLLVQKEFQQNKTGFQNLVEEIEKFREPCGDPEIGMESTGVYHINLFDYLKQKEYDVRVFNSLEMRMFRKTSIRQVHTDKIDPIAIAKGLRILESRTNVLDTHPPDYYQWREYGRSLKRVKKKATITKIQLHRDLDQLIPGYSRMFQDVAGPTSSAVLRRIIKQTTFLKIDRDEFIGLLRKFSYGKRAELVADRLLKRFKLAHTPAYLVRPLIDEVKLLLQELELYRKEQKFFEKRLMHFVEQMNPLILSIPGITALSAGIIMGELGDLKRFKNGAAMVAFAGLDPRVYKSGKYHRESCPITHRGSNYLRHVLYEVAFPATRVNPVLRDFYQRLRHRDKPHRVALCACARKLLMIIYAMYRDNKPFFVPKRLLVSEKKESLVPDA
jgi:transposase